MYLSPVYLTYTYLRVSDFELICMHMKQKNRRTLLLLDYNY